jgi:hypothetical protein
MLVSSTSRREIKLNKTLTAVPFGVVFLTETSDADFNLPDSSLAGFTMVPAVARL